MVLLFFKKKYSFRFVILDMVLSQKPQQICKFEEMILNKNEFYFLPQKKSPERFNQGFFSSRLELVLQKVYEFKP